MADQLEPGKTISFRLPNHTPSHVITYLNKLKKTEGRKFSSKIAPLFVDAIDDLITQTDSDNYSLPLSGNLSKEEMQWLENKHTKALISQIVLKLATDPEKAFELLAQNNEPQEEQPQSEKLFQANDVAASFMDQAFFADLDDDDD
ncbi:MAG: hypothetical protein WBV93_00520 [Anaerobacillus sp.]